VRGRLSEGALANPKVRRLLAVAAARLADRDAALKLTKNLPAAQTAEVLAALARAAIESGDLDTGARDLAQASALDAKRAELAGLSDILQKRRAAEREPLEEEVRRLLAEGRFEEAEARAAELLRRWPESHVGRSATRAVEEHKRAQRARELHARAEEVIARGDATEAISLLKQALAGGLSEERAEAARKRVAALEAEARARKAQAEIDEVCRRLKEADLTDGLRAYLGLTDPQRRAVRERAAIPHIGWLEEALAQGSGARGKAAVSAVVALGRAIEVARTNPGAALDLLAPHSKALQGVGAARDLMKEARARREEQQIEEARARMGAARRALDEGGEGAARRAEEILSGALLRDAPEVVRGELEDLRTRIKSAAARQALVDAFEKYRRGMEVMFARNTADELARTAPDEAERERWGAASADLRDLIQRMFHVEVIKEPVPASALVDLMPPRGAGALRLLLPGGERMVIAQAFEERVFLRVVDLASATVCTCIAVYAMSPFELVRAEVREGRVILIGLDGTVLVIGLEDGEVIRRYRLYPEEDVGGRRKAAAPKRESPRQGDGALASPEASAEPDEEPTDDPMEPLVDAQMAPGDRLCWFVWQSSSKRQHLRIAGIEQTRPIREIRTMSAQVFMSALFGMKEPRMGVFLQDEEEVALFDLHGAATAGARVRIQAIPRSLAACPDGEHVFLLAREPRPKSESDREKDAAGWACLPLGSAEALAARRGALAQRSAQVPVRRVEGLDPEVPVAVATNPSARMIYALFGSRSGDRELLGLSQPEDPARSAELCEVFRVPVPRRTWLLEDPGEGRAVAVVKRGDGFVSADLGRDPPTLEADGGPGELPEELMTAEYNCGLPTGAALSAVSTLIDAIRREDRASVLRRVKAAEKRADPDHVVALGVALAHSRNADLTGDILGWAHERFPTHAGAALENASAVIWSRRWRLALEVLEGIDPTGLDAGRAQHFHHVVAAAKLHLNEPEEALRALERGRAVAGGRCNLDCLLALVTPLGEEREEEVMGWSADQAAVRELVRAVALADARLAQGDAAGARAAVDRRVVWEAREVQSLARLAEAHLAEEPAAPYDRFRKGLSLAAFRAMNSDFRMFMRREVPFARARWERARLNEVAERARAWLSASFGDRRVMFEARHAPYVCREALEP
jgi:hypothetical protein